MGGTLLAIEKALDEMILDHHAPTHGRGRLRKQRLGRARCLARQRKQLDAGIPAVGFVHRASRRLERELARSIYTSCAAHKCNGKRGPVARRMSLNRCDAPY